ATARLAQERAARRVEKVDTAARPTPGLHACAGRLIWIGSHAKFGRSPIPLASRSARSCPPKAPVRVCTAARGFDPRSARGASVFFAKSAGLPHGTRFAATPFAPPQAAVRPTCPRKAAGCWSPAPNGAGSQPGRRGTNAQRGASDDPLPFLPPAVDPL